EANRFSSLMGASVAQKSAIALGIWCGTMTLFTAFTFADASNAQRPGFNYDESRVPSYTLPEVLEAVDGTPIKTPQQWRELRRSHLLALFKEHVYGTMPPRIDPTSVTIEAEENAALEGKAIRREVAIRFGDE